MKVKICGITREEDAILAASLGADFLGFILSVESKRMIDAQKAASIIQKVKKQFATVQAVIVVTQCDKDYISQRATETGADWVQVHADCSAADFNAIPLKNKIKVFRIQGLLEKKQVSAYDSPFFLFDTFSTKISGGTGKSFDWDWIPKDCLSKSIIAGGIGIEQLPALIKLNPYAIDVNSKVELSPGIKSKEKLAELFKLVSRK